MGQALEGIVVGGTMSTVLGVVERYGRGGIVGKSVELDDKGTERDGGPRNIRIDVVGR